MVVCVKKAVLSLLVVSIMAMQPYISVFAETETFPAAGFYTGTAELGHIFDSNRVSYSEYRKGISGFNPPEEALALGIGGFGEHRYAAAEIPGFLENPENPENAIILEAGGELEWEFFIPSPARYAVYVNYATLGDAVGHIEAEIRINGRLPFREAAFVEINKTWVVGDILTDILGNHIPSSPVEVTRWRLDCIPDPAKLSAESMELAFDSGPNVLSLHITSGGIAIEGIILAIPENPPTYAEYKAEIAYRPDDSAQNGIITLEAENPLYYTGTGITLATDASSPFTSPQTAGRMVINAIGNSEPGRKITYEIKVDYSGYYKIAMRASRRGGGNEGAFVTRSVFIDGVSPFAEAKSQIFMHSDRWYMQTVNAGGEDCLFYFEKGQSYLLSLEADVGPLKNSIEQVGAVIENLKKAYLDIRVITGASPDIYRDYDFPNTLPETIALLRGQNIALKEIAAEIEKNAERSQYTAAINNMIRQLDKMTDKPALIASMFGEFHTNIGALGVWLQMAKDQWLMIDKLFIVPGAWEPPTEKRNIFAEIAFAIKRFLASFSTNYSMVGQTEESLAYDESIKVWVVTGREQAQIIKRLSDSLFSPQNKVRVDIELVTEDTLLPSVMAGTSADISLMNGQGVPVNYAVRNAVYDLNSFDDINEVLERFYPEAIAPFSFGGHIYALPDTFSFLMFFYRTDIFEDFGLAVPETWDDLLKLIHRLQKHKMDAGIATGFFLTLFQQDVPIYNEGGKSSNLGSDAALRAFNDYCEQFTVYSAPAIYDFANRFRTGEMPCAIADYTSVNLLNLMAPEIRGMWDFVPLPGVYKSDGSFENTTIAGTTGSMILASTKKPNESWEYIKWWLSADVQSQFAIEMEKVFNLAGKYATANIEAFEKMTWTAAQRNNILKQMEFAKTVPEVPGGYYTARVVDFAFNKVYTAGVNPTDALLPYIEELDAELSRKRAEFGLE